MAKCVAFWDNSSHGCQFYSYSESEKSIYKNRNKIEVITDLKIELTSDNTDVSIHLCCLRSLSPQWCHPHKPLGWCRAEQSDGCQHSWRNQSWCSAQRSLWDTCWPMTRYSQANDDRAPPKAFTSSWWRSYKTYLVTSLKCWMVPGGSVSRVRVLLTAMVILHGMLGSLWNKLSISASKGRWPPLCSVNFTPFTHCNPKR